MVSTNAAGTSDAITSSKTNAAVRQRRRIIKAGDESVVPPPLLLSSSLPTKKRRRKEFNNLISPRHKAVIVGSSVLGIVLVSCTLMFIILLGRIDDNGSNLATESFKDGSNLRKNAILQEEITTDASSKSSTKSSSANDLEHVEIYEALFQRSSKTVPEYHRGRYELSSTYSTSVMKQGCNLTVVLMDPRLPILPAGDPTWFSLESIAAYASTACVLLQTSYCIIQDSEDDSRDNTDESAQEQVVEIIYEHSLPLFRRMIEQGQVRVVFLDHEKVRKFEKKDYFWIFGLYA
uniref:Uncharacterized protein n=1 Tax=Ditylum brightwellii TaxID=49249 RepID=A0A7S4VJV2_9STRA